MSTIQSKAVREVFKEQGCIIKTCKKPFIYSHVFVYFGCNRFNEQTYGGVYVCYDGSAEDFVCSLVSASMNEFDLHVNNVSVIDNEIIDPIRPEIARRLYKLAEQLNEECCEHDVLAECESEEAEENSVLACAGAVA